MGKPKLNVPIRSLSLFASWVRKYALEVLIISYFVFLAIWKTKSARGWLSCDEAVALSGPLAQGSGGCSSVSHRVFLHHPPISPALNTKQPNPHPGGLVLPPRPPRRLGNREDVVELLLFRLRQHPFRQSTPRKPSALGVSGAGAVDRAPSLLPFSRKRVRRRAGAPLSLLLSWSR